MQLNFCRDFSCQTVHSPCFQYFNPWGKLYSHCLQLASSAEVAVREEDERWQTWLISVCWSTENIVNTWNQGLLGFSPWEMCTEKGFWKTRWLFAWVLMHSMAKRPVAFSCTGMWVGVGTLLLEAAQHLWKVSVGLSKEKRRNYH